MNFKVNENDVARLRKSIEKIGGREGSQYGFSQVTKGITFFVSTNKKRETNFEIHFTQNIPAKEQNKIAASFNEHLRKKGVQTGATTDYDRRKEIANIILSFLPTSTHATARRVLTDFFTNKADIAINKGSSAIRGALGEIYWAAFFDYIGLNAIPTGFDVHSKKGKMIPVDIALEDIGF